MLETCQGIQIQCERGNGDLLEEEGGDGPDGRGDCCQQPLGRQLTSMNVLALENNEQEVMEREHEVILSGWISLLDCLFCYIAHGMG